MRICWFSIASDNTFYKTTILPYHICFHELRMDCPKLDYPSKEIGMLMLPQIILFLFHSQRLLLDFIPTKLTIHGLCFILQIQTLLTSPYALSALNPSTFIIFAFSHHPPPMCYFFADFKAYICHDNLLVLLLKFFCTKSWTFCNLYKTL